MDKAFKIRQRDNERGSVWWKRAILLLNSEDLPALVKKYAMVFFVVYKVVLMLLYSFFQFPLVGAYGSAYPRSISCLIWGWVIYLATAWIIRKDQDDICSMFICWIFMFSIAPFIVIYEFSPFYKLWMIVLQVVCLLFMRWLLSLNIKLPNLFRGISYKDYRLHICATILLVGYLVYTVMVFGLPSADVLSFYEVHNVRKEVSLSTFQSILQNVVCKALIPLYLVLALKLKKWAAVVFVLAIQVYTYSVTGFKTYLFIPAMVLFLQLLPKLSVRRMMVAGLPLGCAVYTVLCAITQSEMLYGLIGDRMIFMPAKIKGCYFDFFSSHEYVRFSQNTISKLLGIQSNYDVFVPNMIGDLYFNRPQMWTNTGFMADAYANLGIPGMIIIAVMLAAVLIVLRHGLCTADPELSKALQSAFMVFFLALNDGPLISELFSGGMLVAVMLVLVLDFRADAPEKTSLHIRKSFRTLAERERNQEEE